MKFSIEGFSQEYALSLQKEDKKKILKIDSIDLVILRWFVDFINTSKMKSIIIDNKQYYWVNYEKVVEEHLPILNIKKRTLYDRLQKMVSFNLLEHYTDKNKGTFSYYRIGENYENLVCKNFQGCAKNFIGGYAKNFQPKDNILLVNTNIKDNTINNNITNNINKNNNIYISIEKFWKVYPKKKNKGNIEKWFEKNKPDNELLERIIKSVEQHSKTEDWKKENGKYIPYPSTWLNNKGWEDELHISNSNGVKPDDDYDPSKELCENDLKKIWFTPDGWFRYEIIKNKFGIACRTHNDLVELQKRNSNDLEYKMFIEELKRRYKEDDDRRNTL